MPQSAYTALRIETVDLPSGPYAIRPDPVVSGATQYQHQMITIANGTHVSLVLPAGVTFLFVGFPTGNTQTLAFSSVFTDVGITIGPTGWVAYAVPLSGSTQNIAFTNTGASSVVELEVIFV